MQGRTWIWIGAVTLAAALGLGTALVQNTGAPVVTPVADAVQRALAAGKPTVVEFGANACASCREMKPVLEALRREHGARITVAEVDLIAQRKEVDYIRRYRIQLMPTQVFFDAKGREVGRHLGKLTLDELVVQLEKAAANPS